MSQVIVTEDTLHDKRVHSREEEARIIRGGRFGEMEHLGIDKTTVVERLIGIAVLPILAAWLVLFIVLAVVLTCCSGLFRCLGLNREARGIGIETRKP